LKNNSHQLSCEKIGGFWLTKHIANQHSCEADAKMPQKSVRDITIIDWRIFPVLNSSNTHKTGLLNFEIGKNTKIQKIATDFWKVSQDKLPLSGRNFNVNCE
jgi:hypothetical protein